MSEWGQAQDRLHELLWGVDVGYGEWQEGLLPQLGVTHQQADAVNLEERIIETLAVVFQGTRQ